MSPVAELTDDALRVLQAAAATWTGCIYWDDLPALGVDRSALDGLIGGWLDPVYSDMQGQPVCIGGYLDDSSRRRLTNHTTAGKEGPR